MSPSGKEPLTLKNILKSVANKIADGSQTHLFVVVLMAVAGLILARAAMA